MGYFSSHNHTTHSNYRLPDSTNSPIHLFNRAIEAGLTGFAVTDHESLSAHKAIMNYHKKLEENNKKAPEKRDPSLPILPDGFTVGFGDEAYLVDRLGMNQRYWHWLLIARNESGHRALRKLSTRAWENSYMDRGMQRVPLMKIDVEEILEETGAHDDLIVTSACIGGELGYCALNIKSLLDAGTPMEDPQILSYKQQMVDYVNWNKSLFGENFYIELAPNDKEEQRFCNEMFWNLSKSMGVKAIFATDSHYLTKEDRDIHRAFLNSRDGEREVDDFYSTAYMMTKEEVKEFFLLDFTEEQFEEMVTNLEEMRSKITHYSLDRPQEVPVVELEIPEPSHPEVPKEYEFIKIMEKSDSEQDLFWVRTCLNELYKRGKWDDSRYLKVLNNEAEVLVEVSKKMGASMTSYYNTAKRLIEVMWDDKLGNSLVGPSRGSAMAFLSNWLLDITQIDPIPYEIPFWRHLSKSRPELPDIDIDSEGFRKEDIIDAIKKEFGRERVLNICTYGTEGTKSAIMTAARGLGVPLDVAEYLKNLIPNSRGFDAPLKEVYYEKPIKEFVEEIDKYPGLLETAMALEGIVSGRGAHAAGVYIFNDDFTEYNAMMKTSNGIPVTQWDMGESDEMGGVKFDFLSIEGLDKIRAAMNLLLEDGYMKWKGSLKETYDHYFYPEGNLDYDEKLWEPSWTGEVIDLFQFDTPVGGEAIKLGRPRNVIEASALNSIMRLMPMEDGTVPTEKYASLKENIDLWYKELETYKVPKSEVKILEDHYLQSFGVPNTQEELG